MFAVSVTALQQVINNGRLTHKVVNILTRNPYTMQRRHAVLYDSRLDEEYIQNDRILSVLQRCR